MNFYTLTQDRTYSKWSAMLPKIEERRLNLFEHVTPHSVWKDPQAIRLKMHSYQELTANVKYADMHPWQHDTRLDMVPPPWANKVIISPRFNNLLAAFDGPEHGLYPIHLSNYYNTGDEERDYYLLHLPYHHFQRLSYPKTSFIVADYDDVNTEPYKRFAPGEIRSYEEYLQVREEINDLFPDGYLTTMVWVYDEPWDFLWAETNEILVSERVKERAEQEGLVGVQFELFKDAVIVTGAGG